MRCVAVEPPPPVKPRRRRRTCRCPNTSLQQQENSPVSPALTESCRSDGPGPCVGGQLQERQLQKGACRYAHTPPRTRARAGGAHARTARRAPTQTKSFGRADHRSHLLLIRVSCAHCTRSFAITPKGSSTIRSVSVRGDSTTLPHRRSSNGRVEANPHRPIASSASSSKRIQGLIRRSTTFWRAAVRRWPSRMGTRRGLAALITVLLLVAQAAPLSSAAPVSL